ncbi:MLO-like protein 1, variant 2 [Lathyrus oleraceus]|uniref:MLO-like protein 1, variant 2 n=1 Tax=Pisum sativum TaxID=3888 RepID=A0A9D5A8V3_PEA|nr:MLO-like protein 1, variant 2 [Pisum sativum]
MSGGGEGGEDETTLEFTPTWVVAAVCTIIVAISLAAERLLHYGGKYLKRKDQKPLYEALQKIKEELMLLGFISLLLTVSQNGLTKICVPPGVLRHMLPCTLKEKDQKESQLPKSHSAFSFPGIARRLLADRLLAEAEAAEEAHPKTSFCSSKVCLLLYLYSSSIDRLIFDFVLFSFFFRARFLCCLLKLCIISTSSFLFSPSFMLLFRFSPLFLEAPEYVSGSAGKILFEKRIMILVKFSNQSLLRFKIMNLSKVAFLVSAKTLL